MAKRNRADDDTSLPEADAQNIADSGSTEVDEQTEFNQIVKQAGGGELAKACARATDFIVRYPHLEDRLRAAMPVDAKF